jgi:hypothetical protein
MINTTVTIEQSFQVLDSIPVAPPGSNIAQYFESNATQLQPATKILNVTFVTPKIASNYGFTEAYLRNTVDDPVPEFDFTITNQTVTGFQVVLSAKPTTTNNYFVWSVIVPT